MRKLFALFLVATFILGDYTISQMSANASNLKDERAENLLSQARVALGGDAAINAVTNLVINGTVAHKVKFHDNTEKTMNGKVEMALELPDKLHKKMNIGDGADLAEAGAGKKVIVKTEDVLVRRSADGEPGEAVKFQHKIAAAPGNELGALIFGLLAKTSPLIGTAYNYLGEGMVDGTAADIVEATGGERGSVKIYLDKQSHLPLMVSYFGVKAPQMFIMKMNKEGGAPTNLEEKDVFIFNHKLPEGEKAAADGDVKVIVREMVENGEPKQGEVRKVFKSGDFPRVQLEGREIQIRFSDYRSVNGLMLPHRLVEVVGGQEGVVTTVESYQVNAANLGERFKNESLKVRVPRVEKIN